MKKLLLLVGYLIVSNISSAEAADRASLKATFVAKGKAPAPAAISNVNDPFCAPLKIMSEDVVVDPKTGAIKNVGLYVDSKTIKPADLPVGAKSSASAKLILDNKNCRFEPHVLVVRPGQSLEVKNSDKTGHNANFSFLKNEPVNFQVPAGGSKALDIKEEEPAPIPVSCGSHPWMKAFVIIQDHPFVGISDDNGVLEINDLPAGKVTFRLWREVGSIKNVTINGKKVAVKRGRIELELKPGQNDLGKIEIDASELAAN